MPLLRLVAEGVGPFDRVELDLSDGKGKSHLGPHILAGVNGSGKSTILRAIAWIFDGGGRGFPYDDWQHLIAGHRNSRALAIANTAEGEPFAMACTSATMFPVRPSGVPDHSILFYPDQAAEPESLKDWIRSETAQMLPAGLPFNPAFASSKHNSLWVEAFANVSQSLDPLQMTFPIAAYSPSRSLRHIPEPLLAPRATDPKIDSLSFERTVQNDAIQQWLLSLYSRRAIAKERHLPTEEYTESLDRFESALRLLYGADVRFHVEIKPSFQPRLQVFGRSLNFSQLPDGIRATVGWIADFMMRQDTAARRPGVLLLDEIDAHLHPLWQRKLLPAIRDALPDVQIIVTSHSPFVISSCPGARVHVFDLDEHGKASNRPPIDSPIGESVQTTLKEIFGVDSRFDVQTEAELNEWNNLKKKEAVGRLRNGEGKRLLTLTQILSERSEELRSIVASPLTIPKSVLKSLTGAAQKKMKTG